MLLLKEMVSKSKLNQYEIIPHGSLGASIVAWLCGLAPFNPLTAEVPFYPEFCYGIHWDQEPEIALSVPIGKSKALFSNLSKLNSVKRVTRIDGKTSSTRYIIPNDGIDDEGEYQYFELKITENSHLKLLKQMAVKTGVNPESISFDDKNVLALFQHADHPALMDNSSFRLTAVGLFGLETFHELEFYSTCNIDLNSFADLVRVYSLSHSSDGWIDCKDGKKNSAYQWDYIDSLCSKALITCVEDVYEHCQNYLRLPAEQAFIAAQSVQKRLKFPYPLPDFEDWEIHRTSYIDELHKIVPDDLDFENWDGSYKDIPTQFHFLSIEASYLTRTYSYCCVALAWRCAWYRLHYSYEFYSIYFESIADPQIADVIYVGKWEYDRFVTDHFNKIKQESFFEKGNDIDIAVADEMFFQGIHLRNPNSDVSAVKGMSLLKDMILSRQLTVLAGAPAMGKTTLALDLLSICDKNVGPVYVAPDSNQYGLDRFSQAVTKQSIPHYAHFDTVEQAIDIIQHSPHDRYWLIIDLGRFDLLQDVYKKLNELTRNHNVSVLIIDSIYSVERRKNRRPLLQDLRRYDCLDLIDNVIMLYRNAYYDGWQYGSSTCEAEAIVAKSMSGNNVISLNFNIDERTFL